MTENQTGTLEPIGFDDVHVGDTISFSRRDNGFGGTGDILRRSGTVTKVTAETVSVDCCDLWGRTGILRRTNWTERYVLRSARATRRPYNAENVQYLDDGNIVTAVWCSDPTIDPRVAYDNLLRRDLPYEVEVIAEATRHYKREGADFSGWIISRGADYSTEPIKRKTDAVKQLRLWVEGRFTR